MSRVAGSLLHRLFDPDGASRGVSLPELYASICRDLQALLNARRPWAAVPDRFKLLRDSMLCFGLPDFAAGAFNHAAERETLCKEIAATIARFEPRLADVSVKLRDRPGSMDPLLRIRIDGVLLVDGEQEPVGFDTVLDVTTSDMHLWPAANV